MKGKGEALSQVEIEALLASLPLEDGGGAAAAPAAAGPTGGKVRTWDFRKPDKFSKDHMRSLLALHQSFARIAANALGARLRSPVTVRVTSVDQGLYDEYIDLLPAQSIVNVVSLKPLEGNIIFEFQPELAMGMLERLLGGATGGGYARPELTDIEMALVRNLVRTLLAAMSEAWTNLVEIAPQIEDVVSSPQLVQIASPGDIVVIVLLEVQVGDRMGTFSLCIPHLLLEPLMPRLSAQVWVVSSSRRRPPNPELRAQIQQHLRQAGVKVTAVVGEAQVTVDELARLQPGDVLLLDPGAVTTARLDVVNYPAFTGVPGLLGGRLAVKITGLQGDGNGDG